MNDSKHSHKSYAMLQYIFFYLNEFSRRYIIPATSFEIIFSKGGFYT